MTPFQKTAEADGDFSSRPFAQFSSLSLFRHPRHDTTESKDKARALRAPHSVHSSNMGSHGGQSLAFPVVSHPKLTRSSVSACRTSRRVLETRSADGRSEDVSSTSASHAYFPPLNPFLSIEIIR